MSHPTTSWPLIPTVPTGPVPVPPGGATGATAPSALNQFSPLGNGIIRPFQRDQKGDFAHASDVALVKAALGQILGTAASSQYTQGELPWRPEFGSLLHHLKHRPNNQTLDELARTYVLEAVARWEPRVRINEVSIARSSAPGGENTFTIRVSFSFVDIATGAVLQKDLETSILI